jgi:hypothetical protein
MIEYDDRKYGNSYLKLVTQVAENILASPIPALCMRELILKNSKKSKSDNYTKSKRERWNYFIF